MLTAARNSRHAASRSRIGAKGAQDGGGELSGYSKHSENGKGCGGPNESNATIKPRAAERTMVIVT